MPSFPAALLAAAVLLSLALPGTAAAQEVEERVRGLVQENARRYVRPVTAGLGAAMNSGWFQGAAASGPLGLSLDVRLTGAMVPPGNEGFTPELPASLTVTIDGQERTYQDPYGSAEGITTPTVSGSGAGARVPTRGVFHQDLENAGEDPADYALRFPDGLDLPAVPMVVPQATLGLPLGTDVAVRWIPSIRVTGEIGEVKAVGVGARHSLSHWLSDGFPLDVSVSGGVQRLEAGGYLEADARSVELTVSKTLSILTLYAAGGLEDSEVRVSYTLEDSPLPGRSGRSVSFRSEGANDRRFTAGLSLDLLFLRLSADYTAARYDVIHASVGLGI